MEPLGEGARLTPACGTNNGPGMHTCTLTTPTAHRIVTLVTQLTIRYKSSSSLLHKAAESKAAVRVSTAGLLTSLRLTWCFADFQLPGSMQSRSSRSEVEPSKLHFNKHPKSAELSVSSVRKEKHGHDCRSEDKDKKCGEMQGNQLYFLLGTVVRI